MIIVLDRDSMSRLQSFLLAEFRKRRKHAAGTRPDTSLFLGDERRGWLIRQGGIQPTIQRLIDDALAKGGRPRKPKVE